MIKSSKCRSRMASIFLFAYLTFLATNASHYHEYSLLLNPSYSTASQNNASQSHYYSGNLTICVIHQFFNSILDLKFTNSASCSTNGFEKLSAVIYNEFIPKFFLKIISNRAPPAIS